MPREFDWDITAATLSLDPDVARSRTRNSVGTLGRQRMQDPTGIWWRLEVILYQVALWKQSEAPVYMLVPFYPRPYQKVYVLTFSTAPGELDEELEQMCLALRLLLAHFSAETAGVEDAMGRLAVEGA